MHPIRFQIAFAASLKVIFAADIRDVVQVLFVAAQSVIHTRRIFLGYFEVFVPFRLSPVFFFPAIAMKISQGNLATPTSLITQRDNIHAGTQDTCVD